MSELELTPKNRHLLHSFDTGVPEDDAEAVRWYRLSAEQGGIGAAFALGSLYTEGASGVPKDPAEAVRWFRQVADFGLDAWPGLPQGYVETMALRLSSAESMLGLSYETGRGVLQDDVEAYKWYNLATVHADGSEQERSAELRDSFAERLTPQQRAEGQKLSREWLAAHTRVTQPRPR